MHRFHRTQLASSNPRQVTKFWVNYRYQAGAQVSGRNKSMTGFRLNWRLENTPVLEAKIDKLGKMVETPRFGGNIDPKFFTADHVFKMRVQFPENLLEQLGNGSLVMQLEVDTREAKTWDEEVHFWMGDTKFSSDEDLYKSWSDADAYCKAEGGHLASMKTDADIIEINRMSEGWNVWVGGKEGSDQKLDLD